MPLRDIFTKKSGESASTSTPSAPVDLGLPPGGLQANGISIGFFPEYGKYGARQVQEHLPAPTSIVGDYVQISDSDMEMKQVDWHLDDVMACPDAVYAPAIMPQSGLKTFDAHKADLVASKMAEVNRKGRTVWLRFGHEMNGDWYAWGRQPKEFVAAWQLLAKAVRAKTAGLPARTLMLWAPNVADSTSGKGGYKDYYPGSEYVDLCGLSIYVYDDCNRAVPSNSFSKRFADFYKLYGEKEGKPIVLAETSAPYRYHENSPHPLHGDCDELTIKLEWLHQIVGENAARRHPMLKAIVWFNYHKNEDGQTRDFRGVLGIPQVSQAFSQELARLCRS